MNKLRPMTYAILAAILFGISAPLAKLLLAQVAPITMAGLLYTGSGGAAGLVLLLRKCRKDHLVEAPIEKHEISWLAGAVLAGGILAPILLMKGLSGTPASTAALLLNFESASTTFLAAILFHEAVGRRVWLSVGIITGASILLTWDQTTGWGFSWSALAILSACVLWGLDNNLTRHVSSRDPLTIVAIKGLGAGIFSLGFGLVLGEGFPSLSTAIAAMLLGAICYGLSIVLFILAMRELGAARTGALFASAPFIGALISIPLFHETPGLQTFLAGFLLLTGTLILLREDHQHSHKHKEELHSHSHTHDAHHQHHEEDIPGWHSHFHSHAGVEHSHPHMPDLHHRHAHSQRSKSEK